MTESSKFTAHYEVIGRAVVTSAGGHQQHALKLLYRGDGTPWWTCSAGLELNVPAEFAAKPGDTLALSLEVVR